MRTGTQRKGLGVAVIAACVLAAATVRAITPATPMAVAGSAEGGTAQMAVAGSAEGGTAQMAVAEGGMAQMAVAGSAEGGTAQMAMVPGGTFPMGCDSSRASERPRHLVSVAAFAIDATEVTARDYDACVFARVCKPAGIQTGDSSLCNDARTRPNHPANCVDWNDAHAFCAWAGNRLPTEEEWEYAARGDDERAYPWGDASPMTNMVNALGDGDGFAGTSPVATYDAGRSPFSVYDMAGNVWEWTDSAWSDDYASPREYDLKVVRGGGFGSSSPALLRSTARGSHRTLFRDVHLGFRCAK